jgi:NitT/TauT family transport system substrate-binding protein
MSRRLASVVVVLAIIAAAHATGCARREPLRIGLNAFPSYEFLYLADVQGFYRDEGLEARVLEFSSLSDTRRAYERGQLDVMGGTVIEALVVRDQSDRSPQIVRVLDYSDGADVILAQPWITSADTLRGARVGVELATLPVYVLGRGLEALGLRLADIRTSSTDQATMEEAFRRGDLDALVTYPPASLSLTRDLKTTTLFSSADVPGEIVDVILVEAETARTRAADVAAMLRAHDRARRFAREHPADAHAIMARREGITAGEFAASLSDGVVLVDALDQTPYFGAGGRLPGIITRAERLLRDTGQVSRPARTADLVSTAFLGGGGR